MPRNKKRQDLTGKQFGEWTAIEPDKDSARPPYYTIRWMCRCSCGTIKSIRAQTLKEATSGSCGCKPNPNRWKGYGEISGNYWSRLQTSAKKRSIPFVIEIEDTWKLFEEQNRLCAFTGWPIQFVRAYLDPRKTGQPNLQTASLDRIDSSRGYTPDNVHWVHVDVNYCKQNYSVARFKEICAAVYQYDVKDN